MPTTFKRRTPEQIREHFRRAEHLADAAELAEQQFWVQQRAARQAELRGAMRVGELYSQEPPGAFATDVYQSLSDPQRAPTVALLKLLQLMGEA